MTGQGLHADISFVRNELFRLDVSLGVGQGESVALVGPNGSGKSTAVHVLAGLLRLSAGSVRLNDTIFDDPSRGVFVPPDKRRIGVMFQDHALFPHLTVRENIEFGPRSTGKSRADCSKGAMEWLERLGLVPLSDRKPGDLSGGQAQSVALARVLNTDPGMLVLDEPLAALDIESRAGAREIVARFTRDHSGPSLIVTHDPAEAFYLADRVYIIEDGLVTQSGSANEIRLKPKSTYAARIAGSNMVVGVATAGKIDTGVRVLRIADTQVSGSVMATIHPHSIAVHLDEPHGSAQNVWQTVVDALQDNGDTVRLRFIEPLALTAEVTKTAADTLGLGAGSRVWVSIKATEFVVRPIQAGPSGGGDDGRA